LKRTATLSLWGADAYSAFVVIDDAGIVVRTSEVLVGEAILVNLIYAGLVEGVPSAELLGQRTVDIPQWLHRQLARRPATCAV